MHDPNSISSLETPTEPVEVVVRRLVRALDYAEGFWLGLVKCNAPVVRRKVALNVKELLETLKVSVIELDLTEPVSELLPLLKQRLADERDESAKTVFFVYGLEHSISSSETYPPILSHLNFNRELFREELPHALVIWLPEYALIALAHRAPDFWAWRSGFYEIAPDADLTERAYDEVRYEAPYLASSLSERAKRERLTLLKGLLEDYRELGSGPRERRAQGEILSNIGTLYAELGEWPIAKSAFEKSLEIARELNDKPAIAGMLRNLGVLAQKAGDYAEAVRRYVESLNIAQESNDKSMMVGPLHELGIVAHKAHNFVEAQRLYEESLKIAQNLNYKPEMALSLHQLGMLAQDTGNYEEGRRLYEESLKIKQELGDKSGGASTLHQLGLLAQTVGDYKEARRLYEESLKINQDLGNKPDMAISLAQIALIEEQEGKYEEAIDRSKQAEEIFLRLGNQEHIERIQKQRQRLEEMMAEKL